ncbi:hypothetical protein L226DRAFT_564423 [Lentinus tigrinus ALCF2SS1-7]|uniref:uncharacterized protein n=1 Tax=Lentinus tigrinus ALCF2SS1-7 TaxID=1328758 RepID=UPI001166388A|nr:hypothetical protein L226DRAFT_564423 [Lentinus tigrinus ALCF2SS1-7]
MSYSRVPRRGNSVMHSPTRSRRHTTLAALARATHLQTVVRITSIESIELFVTLAGYNAAIARVVEDLEISLPTNAAYPAHLLRELLRLPTNIETLTLHLPSTSPPTILNGLLFPRLIAFTTNLPHHSLVSFLSAHCTLLSLALQLIEKPCAHRRFHHARRPWNDLHQWHLTLLRLPFLEELMLRTHLVVAGPRRSEDTIVSTWANGTPPRITRHPNLFHVSILQPSSTAGGQRLSHWFRRGIDWDPRSEARYRLRVLVKALDGHDDDNGERDCTVPPLDDWAGLLHRKRKLFALDHTVSTPITNAGGLTTLRQTSSSPPTVLFV